MSCDRAAATTLFLFALALRLPGALHPPPPQSDAADYRRLALSLRAGTGFVDPLGRPTAFRPPLYPVFLAALGGSVRGAALVQSFLGAANALLLVALTGRLLGPGPAPWIAGALLAVDPVHVSASSVLLSETLYQSLLLLALLALPPERDWRRLAQAGFWCGLALLTRAAALPVIFVVAAWLLVRHPWRWKAPATLTLVAVLVASPWLLRNALVLGAPVITTQGGITLYSSYRPPQGRILGVLVHDDEVLRAERLGEVEADRRLTATAWRLAVASPARTLHLALLKAAFFWVPVDWEIRQPSGRLAAVYLFALPLAAWGVRRAPLLLPSLILGGLTLFSAAAYGSPRLRFPYEPLVFMLAAAPLAAVWRRPALWVWAASCGALWLAGDLPRQWLRAAAVLVGLW